MANIKDLLTHQFMQEHCLPSNLVYGTAIHKRGAVEFIQQTPDMVEAWAGGLDGTIKEGAGSRRRVTLAAEKGTLQWHCTGNPKNHQIFCKHCIAVALSLTDL